MIELSYFTYSSVQWAAIRSIVYDELGPDAFINTENGPLRERIEIAVSMYRFYSDISSQQPRRNELDALRSSAKNLRASIVDAISVQIGGVYRRRMDDIDADMLKATGNYFSKLTHNLDRVIEQAGTSRDNARKSACDQCWNELLAIWREFGGKPTGLAAAAFLNAASRPAMGSAVPDIPSIRRWLDRQRRRR